MSVGVWGMMSYATSKAHDGSFTPFRSWMFGMSILFLGHKEHHEGPMGYAEEVLLRLYISSKTTTTTTTSDNNFSIPSSHVQLCADDEGMMLSHGTIQL